MRREEGWNDLGRQGGRTWLVGGQWSRVVVTIFIPIICELPLYYLYDLLVYLLLLSEVFTLFMLLVVLFMLFVYGEC